jgi:type II secretion system protein G
MLHTRDLHCFILVYELRSFSRAADILDTVQSLMSSRIRRLEQFIGAPLFLRLHRGVEPTKKGELVYRHAKRVVRDLEELECAVKLDEAMADFAAIGKALQEYRRDTGGYPGAALGLHALAQRPAGEPRWQGPYLRTIPLDPWGRPYLYRVQGEGAAFDLVSLGRDGRPGGRGEDADISNHGSP